MRPPQSWSSARLTLGLAALTVAAWAIAALFGLGDRAVLWGGFIPADFAADLPFARAPASLTPLTATLVHGDLFHLLFNIVILLVCGRAIEPVLGRASLAVLYAAGAYGAAAAHYFAHPGSVVPAVGASGAVSAVIGAYALLFGRQKLKVANPTLALLLNALWLLAAWVALQLIIGFGVAFATGEPLGIAAHVGGFLAGLLLAYPLLLLRYRKA